LYPGNQMVGAALTGPLPPPISPLPSLSTTGRPRVLPTRALTRGAASSSSPALPATPFTRNPVFRGACDKIHALATFPLESETKSARPPNPRPSVGEGTAGAANGDRFWRGPDHTSDHSSHQGTSCTHWANYRRSRSSGTSARRPQMHSSGAAEPYLQFSLTKAMLRRRGRGST
jgi:hypothetical protein